MYSMSMMSATMAPMLAASSGSSGSSSSALVVPPSFQIDGQGDGQLARPMQLLLTMMPDDSGSINSYGNAPAIRRGHNAQLDLYMGHPGNILVRTRYLNGFELFDYSKPEDAVRMNDRNYNPHEGTPLYAQTANVLHEVQRSMARFADTHDVLTMTCILTDGADTSGQSPDFVRGVVETMIASGEHIVAGMAVRAGETDFHRIFLNMGIPEQWIIVLEREEGDIVSGMTRFAQTSRGIRDRATFTQTSMGGFDPQPTPPSTPNGHKT